MKIAILSCFYPFRGGIAQFNANLLNELGGKHDVRAFNFSRQYPSFLFPGKTQKVAQDDAAVSVESEALLDTADPLSWRRTARAIREWGPDLLLMRYWMPYFAPSLGYVAHHMGPGCKVVGILDNVIPHERHLVDKPLTKYFLNSLDGCVTLCKEVEQDLLSVKPDAVRTVIAHPVYTHFGEKLTRAEAERKLGIEGGRRNILFFGLIREYKGLDILLDAFERLDGEYDLLVAGEPYGSFDRYDSMIRASKKKDRIHLWPEYIADSRVKDFFSAADVCVLPYRSATQSGISSVSCHFEVPMIVTDVGGLKGAIGERGTGIVCDEATPECVAEAIRRLFEEDGLRESFVEGMRKENERLSWSGFCKELITFADTIGK